LDRSYRAKSDAAQDTRWVFKEHKLDGYEAFVRVLQQKFMNFKADPNTLSVVVWF
jgi:hypothetical protein